MIAGLKALQNEISELCSGESNGANLRGFLVELFKSDLPFYVIRSANRTLAGKSSDPTIEGIFVRVFTEKSLAESMVQNLGKGEVNEISAMELFRISKDHFLSGNDGLILNDDGRSGLMLPFSIVLSVIHEDILQYEPVSESVFNAVRLVNLVKHNAENRLSYTNSSGFTVITDSEEGIPLDIQSLFFLGGSIRLTTEKTSFDIDGPTLLKVLSLLGIKQETEKYCPPIDFRNEYDTLGKDKIAFTDFSLQLPELEEANISITEEDIAEVKKRDEEAGEEELSKYSPVEIIKGTVKKRPVLSAISLFIFGLILVLFFSHLGMIIAGYNFKSEMNHINYENAKAIYSEYNLGKKADERILSEDERIIDAYSRNEIDRAEAESRLKRLADTFGEDCISDEALSLKDELDESKSNFALAEQTDDVIEKYEYYEKVSPNDQGDFNVSQDNLSVLKSDYLAACAEKAALEPENAQSYINRILAVDENNAFASSLASEIESQRGIAIPIRIHSLTSKATESNGLNIFLIWENISDSPVSGINYIIRFYDSTGNPVYMDLNGETKTAFKGYFEGSFESGYLTSDMIGFANVWEGYADQVARMEIISITYSQEGSSTTITNPSAIAAAYI